MSFPKNLYQFFSEIRRLNRSHMTDTFDVLESMISIRHSPTNWIAEGTASSHWSTVKMVILSIYDIYQVGNGNLING